MKTVKNREIAAILLAAGKGTRMKSEFSKLTHDLLGKPIIAHLRDSLKTAGVDRIIGVVGHDAERVKDALGDTVEFAYQKEQLGTAHAVMAALPLLTGFSGDLLVFVGDCPLISPELINSLIKKHQSEKASITLLTTEFEQTPPYARVLRNEQGRITGIKEEYECNEEEKRVKEVNTSHYCFRSEDIIPLFPLIKNDNSKGEYYLTDINTLALERNMLIENVFVDDPVQILGMNDRYDISVAGEYLKTRFFKKLMQDGVTVKDSSSTYIDITVEIGEDTVIYPGTVIEGNSLIGKKCTIGPHVHIVNSRLKDNVTAANTTVKDCTISGSTTIPPYQLFSGREV